ncbi:MAG TPA: hypothetical protein VJQ61_05525 [Sinomonas sp.]|nr:hypothetical protein [Sinomonas sp.]
MSNMYPPVPPTPPNAPQPPRTRRAVVIGAVVLGLAGAGSAAVWAADQSGSPTPSPSASASAQPGKHMGKPGAGQAGAETLHGQMTVKRPDGSIETVFVQRGTVTDVSDTKLTVKSDDGFTRTYTLNGSTKFVGQGQPKGAAIKSGDVSKGDTIMVRAVQNGSDYVADQVKKGPFVNKQVRQNPGQHRQKGQSGTPSPSPSKVSPSPSSTS